MADHQMRLDGGADPGGLAPPWTEGSLYRRVMGLPRK